MSEILKRPMFRSKIGRRLVLAFSAVSLVFASTAYLSFRSLQEIEDSYERVMSRTLPVLAEFHTLASVIRELESVSEVVSSTRSLAELELQRNRLTELLARTNRTLEHLHAERDLEEELRVFQRDLSGLTDAVRSTVSQAENRLQLDNVIQTSSLELESDTKKLVDRAGSWMIQSHEELVGLLENGGQTPEQASRERALLDQTTSLTEVRFRGMVILEELRERLRSSDASVLAQAQEWYNLNARAITHAVIPLRDTPDRQLLLQEIHRIVEYGVNEQYPLFPSLLKRSAVETELTQLRTRVQELILNLQSHLRSLSQKSERRGRILSQYANDRVRLIEVVSAIGIPGIVILCPLLLWSIFYQMVVRRITQHAEELRRISAGELETPIQSDGDDELSELSHALEMLRQRTKLLKDSESEIIQARERAEELAQSKSRFLATMSHEIRTPLTGIIGYSESLLHDSLSKAERDVALETVIRNGNHLLGVINDILDLSKIEAGKLDVDIVSVDLAELVSDVANLMRHKALEKGLELRIDAIVPLPRRIQTDPVRLKQILINLVGNAVKFTEKGSVRMVVRYVREEHKIRFEVIDTGPGLTPEQRRKLFQAFSQADASTTRKFGGTGLGLIISSSLAQKLGGDIRLESEAGKGCTFIATVSTGDVEEDDLVNEVHRERSSPVAPETLPSISGKILVAEDGEDNRQLICFLLRKMGAEVSTVENGALAVEALERESFDLVLMDAQMPVLDGYTATKVIREKGYSLPVVALTANAMKSDVDYAYSVGCTDFLGKPFTRAQLFTLLRKYLPSGVERSLLAISPHTEELLRETPDMLGVVVDFIRKLPDRYRSLVQASERGDYQTVGFEAHSCRGASGNIGFEELSASFGDVERAASTREPEGVQRELERLGRLVERAGELEAQVRVFCEHGRGE